MPSEQDYTLNLVLRALDEFSSTFSKLNAGLARVQTSQGKVAAGTLTATQGLDKFKGVIQQLSSGNIAGAFTSLASAIPGVGTAVVAVTGVMVALGAVLNKQVEDVRLTINAVDDLSDRYAMAMGQTNQLYNMAKIFNVEVNTLGRTFKAMARQGLDPSIEGLLQVKARLDAVQDPAARTTLAYKLLGRGALLLADMLATSSGELKIWADRANNLQSVTKKMTDDQDAFNRQMAYATATRKDANVTIYNTTLGLKEQVQLWYANSTAMTAQKQAVNALHIAEINRGQSSQWYAMVNAASLDKLNEIKAVENDLMTRGVPVTFAAVQAGLKLNKLMTDSLAGGREYERVLKRVGATAYDAGEDLRSMAAASDGVVDAFKRAQGLDIGAAAEALKAQAQVTYGGVQAAADQARAQRLAARGQLSIGEAQGVTAEVGATQLLAGTADIGDIKRQLQELGMTGADAANTIIQATTQAAAVAVTTGAASMDQATGALAKALGITSATAAGMLQVVIDKMAAIEDKDVTVTVTTEYVDKMSKQYTQYSQFGSGHLRPGTYNVGEAGTEGLTIDEAGRVGIVPHWKWMASGAGVGRRGFKLGTQVESGGDLSSVSFNFGGAAAAMAEHRAILASGTSGLRGSETVAAVTSAGAAVQASQAVAQEVQTAVVAAIQSSQAQLATTVSLPVVAASVRAEQASKENAMLLMQILAVLRRQGTVADNARAVSEAVVLAGQ